MHFNLVDEPWLMVLTADGKSKLVSLTELFEHAHEYQALAGDCEEQDVAVMRFLLGLLHRVFSQVDEQNVPRVMTDSEEVLSFWNRLNRMGEFPVTPIFSYLDKWHDRFDLYDEEHPFYQVPLSFFTEPWNGQEPPAGKLLSVTKLDGSIAKSNNVNKIKVCATREFGDELRLTHPEAARWLIYHQLFDVAASKGYWKPSAVVVAERAGTGVDTKFFPGYGTTLGLMYVQGTSLWETLMLNFVLLRDGFYVWDYSESSHTIQELSSVPPWEWGSERELTPNTENLLCITPTNPVAVLCQQNRRVHLIPDGNCVRNFYSTYGDYVVSSNTLSEQMTLWTDVKDNKTKVLKKVPFRMRTSRFWEFFPNVTTWKQAGVVGWLQSLRNRDFIPKDRVLLYSGFCFELGTMSAVVSGVMAGQMSFITEFQQESSKESCDMISVELSKIGLIAKELGQFSKNLLFCKADVHGGKTESSYVKGARASIQELYYAEVTDLVVEWLRNLSVDDVDVMPEVCKTFRKKLHGHALSFGYRWMEDMGDSVMLSRTVDGKLYSGLKCYSEFQNKISTVLWKEKKKRKESR